MTELIIKVSCISGFFFGGGSLFFLFFFFCLLVDWLWYAKCKQNEVKSPDLNLWPWGKQVTTCCWIIFVKLTMEYKLSFFFLNICNYFNELHLYWCIKHISNNKVNLTFSLNFYSSLTKQLLLSNLSPHSLFFSSN